MAKNGNIQLLYNPKDPPLDLFILVELAKPEGVNVKCIAKGDQTRPLLIVGNSTLSTVAAIPFLAQTLQKPKLYGDSAKTDYALQFAQVQFWVDSANSVSNANVLGIAAETNKHVSVGVYLVGYSLTLADIALFNALHRNTLWRACVDDGSASSHFAHLLRWYLYVHGESIVQAALRTLSGGKAGDSVQEETKGQTQDEKHGGGDKKKDKKQKDKGTQAAEHKKDKQQKKDDAGGSFEINLEGAEDGKVVTRFPPEPSGYLHIGHAKAVLLNQYFAKKYHGKMILRFDDTNPAKEKEEYVQNIIKDLQTLGVSWSEITHTSDWFDKILQYGEKLIKQGDAYVDDTPVDQARKERGERKESVRRNNSVEENLRLWREMIAGSAEGKKCCVRGKIDMSSDVGCMRDPTFFRCKADVPHHRTGTKYKCYPTYDFACPIVDSYEGVTHCLRTIEYHDRNLQYNWIIERLNLRHIVIYDYSRLCFNYTTLSKRKLQWFVDNKHVEGWVDPRFPTVQGVMRRGMTVEALTEFMRLQGASKATNLMSWDKLWSINHSVLEQRSARFFAVKKQNSAVVELSNVDKDGVIEQLLRPQDKTSTEKKTMTTSKRVLLEGEDVDVINHSGEEVTLMFWGNAILKQFHRDGTRVTRITGESNPNGNFKKTDKKLNWVPFGDPHKLCPILLIEFDDLLTVPKLEDDMKLEDYVCDRTKVETPAWGEAALRNVKKGETVQLIRRGFWIVDAPYDAATQSPLVLFNIPDGREVEPSILKGAIARKKSAQPTQKK